MVSKVIRGVVKSELVHTTVPFVALQHHAGHEGRLLLQLHGGGSSAEELVFFEPLIELAWERSKLPPMFLVCASTPPLGFYMDSRDGSQLWETFLVEEFLPHLQHTYRVGTGRQSSAIIGMSMGGYGALKIALRRPELFFSVSAVEPAILPALSLSDLTPRNLLFTVESLAALGVQPPDEGHFSANNPASILVKNRDKVVATGLRIYMEAGSADAIRFHEGTEFLHRLLWKLDVPHEYRHVLGAGHIGPSLGYRYLDALSFIGRADQEDDENDLGDLSDEERRYVDTFPDAPIQTIAAGRQNGLLRLAMRRHVETSLGIRLADDKRNYSHLPDLSDLEG
jgi:S-formylglutathione hydrolase